MITSPHLTVSIVTYYSDIGRLEALLASLSACALPMEVVIVDNSPGTHYFDSLAVLPAKRVKSPKNGGYGYGHNLALTHCGHAPYHLVINPDVIVHAGAIETLIAHMEKEKDIAIAVPKVLNADGTLQALNKLDPTVMVLFLRRFVPNAKRLAHYTMMDVGYDKPCDVPFASGCFMLFRRNMLDQLGGFDERFFLYFEDADISRRARSIGRVRYFPDASITHHWQGGAKKSATLTRIMCKSALQYFCKWGLR